MTARQFFSGLLNAILDGRLHLACQLVKVTLQHLAMAGLYRLATWLMQFARWIGSW